MQDKRELLQDCFEYRFHKTHSSIFFSTQKHTHTSAAQSLRLIIKQRRETNLIQ